MRTEPGPLSLPCIYCGGKVWAVRVGWALMPECSECGRTPAQAYLDKRADQKPVK